MSTDRKRDALHKREVLKRLDEEIHEGLAWLQQPDAPQKVDAVFASRGKLGTRRRPKAGGST